MNSHSDLIAENSLAANEKSKKVSEKKNEKYHRFSSD